MPSQTASSKKPKPSIAELQQTVATLQKENQALQSKNAKLRKDCTNFAKRLKQIEDSGILDVDVAALQAENNDLKYQMTDMQRQLSNLSAVIQNQQEPQKKRFSPRSLLHRNEEETYAEEPDEAYEEETTQVDTGEYAGQYSEEDLPVEAPVYDDTYDALPIEEDFGSFEEEYEEPKHSRKSKKAKKQKAAKEEVPFVLKDPSKSQLTARGVILVVLTIVILSMVISGICGLYATKFNDNSFLGHRFYTVVNDAAEASGISMNDVVWVKTNDIEDVEVKDVILDTRDTRSFATVAAIGTSGGETTLYVVDSNGSYTVSASEYLGTASQKIAGVGKIASYGLQHPYNYFAYHLAAALILIALLLLIPAKRREYIISNENDDYTE